MSSYDRGSKFSVGALVRLEAAGVPVLTSLAEVPTQRLLDEIGITQPDPWANFNHTDSILYYWQHTRNCPQPPNWSSLYSVLKRLDLEDLNQQII